jgi:hypothetical protein
MSVVRRLLVGTMLAALVAMVVPLIAGSASAAAGTCTWVGATSGSWHTATNWECTEHDGVPTATDAVLIDPAVDGLTVDVGADAVAHSLELGRDAPEITDSIGVLVTMRTTADDVTISVGDGGTTIRRSGEFFLGQARVPAGIGARPALRATLDSPTGVLTNGLLMIANATIVGDVTASRVDPDVTGRSWIQGRGWNVIHGDLHVENGFIQPVLGPSQHFGTAAPTFTVHGGDVLFGPVTTMQAFWDTGSMAMTTIFSVPDGVFENHGLLTHAGFPTQTQQSPAVIDAPFHNHGTIRTRLDRAQGMAIVGPDESEHVNTGEIVVGAELGDGEVLVPDGFGFEVADGRTLHNEGGDITIAEERTAQGSVRNTDGGTVTDRVPVDGPGTYTMFFAGPQQVLVGVEGEDLPARLALVWHGEDPPDAELDARLVGTGNHWRPPLFAEVGEPIELDVSAVELDPASYSLTFPRLNPGDPEVCRRVSDPLSWECLPTVAGQQVATTSDVEAINRIWAVAVTLECDPFTDVTITNPFCFDIEWMADEGLTTGFPDGTFRPGDTITRQALAAFLWRLVGEPEPAPDAPTFDDVPESHPFHEAISWLAGEGITTGFDDGTFRPTGAVTRQAMAAFMWRLVGEPEPAPDAPTFDDVSESHPFHEAISWLAEVRISEGFADGTFRPANAITRQAMAAFVRRYSVVVPA